MKFNQKKSTKTLLADKIADALTVKPREDIEDDQVFGTKPQTVSHLDFNSSDSEDEAAISDFRKRNVNLLSEISNKYVGKVVSRKDFENDSEVSDEGTDSEGNNSIHSSSNNLPVNNNEPISSDSDDSLSNNKLAPKRKTKQDVSDSEELVSDTNSESDDYSIAKFQKELNSEDESDDDKESGSDDDNDDEGEGYDISQMEKPIKEDFEHLKQQNVSEEAKKGVCVRNQLLIWEGLLEMRIHLQRCMNTANQMPMPDTYEELKKSNEFEEQCHTAKANIANILDKFLTLQSILFQKFPETKPLSTKKPENKSKQEDKEDSDEEIPSDTEDEEIPSDTDAEDNVACEEEKKSISATKLNISKKRKLEEYENEIAISHKVFKTFRDTTIQKWNDKTRLATAANMKSAPTNTILQQISYILSDRNKLIRRTQLKRSQYDIIGYNPSKEEENTQQKVNEVNPIMKDRKDSDKYIPEIFDDSDFYHQLLRELIECKSADISDPVQLSRQWISLQQMRSKMKRKVDTKASKGRKIKYVVHNQLVNYMAPEKSLTWNDESTNELYSSLFGKMFEHNNVGLNANLENGLKIKD